MAKIRCTNEGRQVGWWQLWCGDIISRNMYTNNNRGAQTFGVSIDSWAMI